MRTFAIRLSVWLALLVFAPGLAAQDENLQRHDGFWISFGLGSGWGNSESVFSSDIGAPLAVQVRLGTTVNQRLLVGVESAAWLRVDIGAATTRANTTLTAMFYPWERGGFYAKGGFGVSNHTNAAITGAADSEYGFGSTFGLGYDIRLGQNLYLTPNVDVLVQSIDYGAGATTTSLTLLTLGLVWH